MAPLGCAPSSASPCAADIPRPAPHTWGDTPGQVNPPHAGITPMRSASSSSKEEEEDPISALPRPHLVVSEMFPI